MYAGSPNVATPGDNDMQCTNCAHVQPVFYTTQLVCLECGGTEFTLPEGDDL